MTWWHAVIISVAGLWAGAINAVVGSGTLVTFPVLIALGYPPVTATTSNALGLVPGSIAGAVGYRHELTGLSRSLIPYAIASFFGAITGSILLLSLPQKAFETIVPVLVAFAVVLVIMQPKLAKRLRRKRDQTLQEGASNPLLLSLIFLIGIYGGYFTAAQGVMLVAVLGILLNEALQRLNAVKNVLTAVVNVVAGAIYAVIAPINWTVVGLLAVASMIGGFVGAKIGRRLSPVVLRSVIVVIGLAATVKLVLD